MAIKNPQLKRRVRNLIKDVAVLERTADIDRITGLYLLHKRLPRGDAMHFAFASLGEVDFLVTWNLRHLYKPSTQEVLREVNMRLRLSIPIIVTPESFLEEEA